MKIEKTRTIKLLYIVNCIHSFSHFQPAPSLLLSFNAKNEEGIAMSELLTFAAQGAALVYLVAYGYMIYLNVT